MTRLPAETGYPLRLLSETSEAMLEFSTRLAVVTYGACVDRTGMTLDSGCLHVVSGHDGRRDCVRASVACRTVYTVMSHRVPVKLSGLLVSGAGLVMAIPATWFIYPRVSARASHRSHGLVAVVAVHARAVVHVSQTPRPLPRVARVALHTVQACHDVFHPTGVCQVHRLGKTGDSGLSLPQRTEWSLGVTASASDGRLACQVRAVQTVMRFEYACRRVVAVMTEDAAYLP